jgi:hypothetical protein
MDLPTIEKMAADLILMATRLARAVEDVLNPRPNKAPLAIYDEATGRWKLPDVPKTAVFQEYVAKASIETKANQLDFALAAHEKAIETLNEPLTAQIGTLSIPPTWFRTSDGLMFLNLFHVTSAVTQGDGSLIVYHAGQRFEFGHEDAQRLVKLLTMLATDECHLASETQQRSGDPLAGDPYDAT